MSFQSFGFLAFLAATVLLCYMERSRKPLAVKLLLLASGIFCLLGTNGLSSLWVLLIGCAVTDTAVRRMRSDNGNPRLALIFACGFHLLVLAAFKYAAFLSGGTLGFGWVPIGISFFTFQQLWLLKEVYTGEYVPAEEDNLVLYGFFFPTLTSGPILRPGRFFPQLRGEGFLNPGAQDAAAGLYAICCGTAKKVLLADPLGGVVNNGWGRLAELSAPAAWMVILGYTLQLYLDFSGYCDIATGCARLLGIRLPVNFDSPYRAVSVDDFWKRWHITLTTFLRECLYFPLGGSRRGTVRTYLNILVIYLVSGIWHGAGWTFIFWGLLHGLAQVTERLLGKRLDCIPKAVRWVLTFAFVNVAWVFFRAPDLSGAFELLKTALTGGFAMPQSWLMQGVLSKEVGALQLLFPALKGWASRIVVLVLFGTGLLVSFRRENTIRKMDAFRPTFWRAVVLCVLMTWSVLSFSGVATFIYSNF